MSDMDSHECEAMEPQALDRFDELLIALSTRLCTEQEMPSFGKDDTG